MHIIIVMGINSKFNLKNINLNQSKLRNFFLFKIHPVIYYYYFVNSNYLTHIYIL